MIAENYKRRQLERIPIKGDEAFRVLLDGPGLLIEGQIVDFNSNGLGVILPPNAFDDEGKIRRIENIQIVYGGQSLTQIYNPKVAHYRAETGRVGFYFQSLRSAHQMRRSIRLDLKKDLNPTIVAPDPMSNSSMLHLKMTRINQKGMEVTTSMTNKHLLPGMVIRAAQIILPGISVETIEFTIKNSRRVGNSLFLGCEFLDATTDFLEKVSQFLLFGASWESFEAIGRLELLRHANLPVRKISKGLKIEQVSSAHDYYEVLRVRHAAYQDAQKLDDTRRIEDMADEHDKHSQLYCAKFDNLVIGTIRVTIGKDSSTAFPLEHYTDYPDDCPKSESLEVSRLAILPQFQGTDLVVALFRQVAKLTIANRRYVLCLATRALSKMYLKMSATKISEEIPHPVLADETLAVYCIDIDQFVSGTNMKKMSWELLAKEVVNQMNVFGFIDTDTPREELISSVEDYIVKTVKHES